MPVLIAVLSFQGACLVHTARSRPLVVVALLRYAGPSPAAVTLDRGEQPPRSRLRGVHPGRTVWAMSSSVAHGYPSVPQEATRKCGNQNQLDEEADHLSITGRKCTPMVAKSPAMVHRRSAGTHTAAGWTSKVERL